MKHHTLFHSQTLRLNDIWDLSLREAFDGTFLQWREQPFVAGHFAFLIMNSDCCPLWSIDERLKETNKSKEKETHTKKERKEKPSTTHAYFLHFLGQFLSLLLLFLLLLLLSNTTPQGLGLGPLFGRFFLLPGGRFLQLQHINLDLTLKYIRRSLTCFFLLEIRTARGAALGAQVDIVDDLNHN